MLHTVGIGGSGPNWTFDGDFVTPTFSPSILVRWNYGDPPRERRCHSFVRAGRIEYCGDCTHALSGKAVDLPEIPEDWR